MTKEMIPTVVGKARELLQEIGTKSRALREGGPDPMDLHDLSDALEEAIDLAVEVESILSALEIAPEVQQETPRSAEPAVTAAMVDAAQRIRDVAMQQTVIARIPECGEFGAIAQDADWLVDALKAAMEAKDE